MRHAFLLALVLATAACGAYQLPGTSPSPATGTIAGHVLSVPCSPVEKLGDTCAGRAVANLAIRFSSGDATEQAVTDAQGAYSIDVPAGTWKVTFKTYMRKISGPATVTVAAGSTAAADYVFDNGIRVPAPAG